MQDHLRLQNLRAAAWRVRTGQTGHVEAPRALRYRTWFFDDRQVLRSDDGLYEARPTTHAGQHCYNVFHVSNMRLNKIGLAYSREHAERVIVEHRRLHAVHNRWATKRLIL